MTSHKESARKKGDVIPLNATASATHVASGTKGAAPQPPVVPPAAPVAAVPAVFDFKDPALYLNRELTWLKFNQRVLNEAADRRTPLLERVKFLAIVGSNLDEFFMKRIGGLKQQIGAGVQKRTIDGRTPLQQFVDCTDVVRDMQHTIRSIYLDTVRELRRQDIVIMSYDKLSKAEREAMRKYYLNNIFPLVTPLALDPAHPFPFISNLSINLFVTLHHADETAPILARVKIPVGKIVPRFLKVGDDHRYVLLEEVMANNLDMLFPDMVVQSCELFRVTRNSNTERDEERADDLLSMIETELRERKFAPIVRLQAEVGMDPVHRGMLAAELGLDEERDVYDSDVMMGMSDLMELIKIDMPELHDLPHTPVDNVVLQSNRNIFHIIRDAGSVLLHHPYESFSTSVERFVKEASLDPQGTGHQDDPLSNLGRYPNHRGVGRRGA